MASTSLTLAALATSAVPDLTVTGSYAVPTGPSGSFVSTVLETDRGRLIVRIPRTAAAEAEQSGELLGHTALTTGTRTRLPFTVPETLGLTRAGDSRAVVSTFLEGEHFSVEDLADDSLLLQPLAAAISAIHDLPRSTVREAGLTDRTATEVRAANARLVERAEATRLLPSTVASRWADVLQATELWEFDPTVVHGTLDDSQVLVLDEQVVGVLGWSELQIGDPAVDFAWLAGAGRSVLTAAIDRYAKLRSTGERDRLVTRAAFAHELDVARWLLHGVEQHDQGVINDAVTMLDRMVDSLPLRAEPVLPHTVLGVDEVGDLLSDTPLIESRVQDTSASDIFDDERVFFADTDFIEPLESPDPADRADTVSASDQAAHKNSPASPAVRDPDLTETGVVEDFTQTETVAEYRKFGRDDAPEADKPEQGQKVPFDPLATAPLEPFDFGDYGDFDKK